MTETVVALSDGQQIQYYAVSGHLWRQVDAFLSLAKRDNDQKTLRWPVEDARITAAYEAAARFARQGRPLENYNGPVVMIPVV